MKLVVLGANGYRPNGLGHTACYTIPELGLVLDAGTGMWRMADYLQQGYFGLRRAAEKFDPERGYTFSTYAAAWIRQALGRYHVENISMVRVPESSAREIFYYDNHGKPRNGKVASWVPDASRAAKAAYSITSYDGMSVDMETNLSEVLSEEVSSTVVFLWVAQFYSFTRSSYDCYQPR